MNVKRSVNFGQNNLLTVLAVLVLAIVIVAVGEALNHI